METTKQRNRFSVLLPDDERYFLKSQDKSFRDKYYMYVFSNHKKGKTPLSPTLYYQQRVNLGLTPFTEIADKMGLSVSQVRDIYKSAMTKIKNAIL